MYACIVLLSVVAVNHLHDLARGKHLGVRIVPQHHCRFDDDSPVSDGALRQCDAKPTLLDEHPAVAELPVVAIAFPRGGLALRDDMNAA